MKKKLLVINPNTSKATQLRMQAECDKIVGSTFTVKCLSLPVRQEFAAEKVFSYIDLLYATVETVRLGLRMSPHVDGILVAGFSDVGVSELREMLSIPVAGIGELSFHWAACLGHRFSVLTGTQKWTSPKEDTIAKLGLSSRIASLKSYSEWTEDLSEDQLLSNLTTVGRQCIEEDRAEVIVIGAGPLAGLGDRLSKILGVPVIDPTIIGYKSLELLVSLGLTHSKVGKWAYPPTEISDSSGQYPYNRQWLKERW